MFPPFLFLVDLVDVFPIVFFRDLVFEAVALVIKKKLYAQITTILWITGFCKLHFRRFVNFFYL